MLPSASTVMTPRSLGHFMVTLTPSSSSVRPSSEVSRKAKALAMAMPSHTDSNVVSVYRPMARFPMEEALPDPKISTTDVAMLKNIIC